MALRGWEDTSSSVLKPSHLRRSQRIPDANFADWTSVDRLLVPLSRHLNLTAETATLVPELMVSQTVHPEGTPYHRRFGLLRLVI